MDSITTTTEHEVRIEIRGIYLFRSPKTPFYQKVLVTFFNGEIVVMKDCDSLEVKLTMPVDLFLDYEPEMIDRL